MANVVASKKYLSEFDVLLAQSEALEFVKTVPDETFQLVVTSLSGMPYQKRRELPGFLERQERMLKEFVRVLRTGGSLCLQSGKYVRRREVVPLDAFLLPLVRKNSGSRTASSCSAQGLQLSAG
ncbi:MAG TPA: hypothetical protein VEG31_04425 [Thermoproteota archaeon]|nr:hypothetical protein [Thermoproteota archaeon]